MSNKSYGGPGSFVPTDGSLQPSNSSGISNISSQAGGSEVSHLNSLPSSLRSSASLPPLYAPHYEQRNQVSSETVDHLIDDFSELGMTDSRRRESYPVSRTDFCASWCSSFPSCQATPYALRPWGDSVLDIRSLRIVKPATRPPFTTTQQPPL